MSADNGIYIGEFGNEGKEFRVIHAQAIDNVYYPNGENAVSIVEYFGRAEVFDTREAAQGAAFKLENEILDDDFCPVLEYGISTLKFSRSFSEYEKEAASCKESESDPRGWFSDGSFGEEE